MTRPGAAGGEAAGSAHRAILLPGIVELAGGEGGPESLACELVELGWRRLVCALPAAAAARLAPPAEATLHFAAGEGAVTLAVRSASASAAGPGRRGEPSCRVIFDLLDAAGIDSETMERLLLAGRPRILMLGLPAADSAICRRALLPDLVGEVVGGEEGLEQALDGREPAVLCLGPALPSEQAMAILDRFAAAYPGAATQLIVSTRGGDLHRLRSAAWSGRLFHVAAEPLPVDDLAVLLRAAAAAAFAASGAGEAGAGEAEAGEETAAGRIGRTLVGQKDLPGALATLDERVRDLLAADRTSCLLLDAAEDRFWTLAGVEVEWRESPAVGLVGFVARTASTASAERLHDDPRFDVGADEPEAAGDERWLGAPLVVGRRVVGVLAAMRGGHRPAFSQRERRLLEVVVEQAAPPLVQLARQWDTSRSGGGLQDTETQQLSTRLFRSRAIESFRSGGRTHGDPLRISPEWTRWTYRLLLASLAAVVLFAALAPVREYATGPALVQLQGRRDLTAATAGTASAVLVTPGAAVQEGDLLVRFYGASELADLERIEQAFELELIKRLRDPLDPAAERALGNLRAERGLAEARLAERDVRAPSAGLVSDVRVRPGQHLTPGQVLVTLQTHAAEPQLLAMLPGSQRPLLRTGMPLRFELEGYEYAYQHLEISAVGDEVVGPAEAQRYLGGAVADAAEIEGPVVFVYARLPTTTFEWNDQRYAVHDGMWGRAEVPVRSESVLLTMAPVLRAVFSKRDG